MADREEGTRTRIVQVGARLFAQQGYHGTGLTELLDAVGLGKGGFYHHMRSKEQLLLEIMLDPIEGILASSEAIAGDNVSPRQRLLNLGSDLGGAMAKDLDAWTVFLREHNALAPAAKLQVLSRRTLYLDRWRKVLRDGVECGDFRPLDLAFVESLFGIFIYSFVWRDSDATSQSVTESIMDVLLHGVTRAVPPGNGKSTGEASSLATQANRR